MSKPNFLKQSYRIEGVKNHPTCGIIDPKNAEPAYTTCDTSLMWNATINNPHGRTFQFVPIDNNIIIYKSDGKSKESTCDGMLLVERNQILAFIELKDARSKGFANALSQLENTIELFRQNHNSSIFKTKRAYIANTAYPQFPYSRKEEIAHFHKKYNFALRPETNIEF